MESGTERKLEFKHRMLPIMGVIFLIPGLALIFLAGSEKRLLCERAGNRCVVTNSAFLGEERIAIPLDQVQQAVVNRRRSSGENRSYVYRVMLETDQGDHQLTVGSSSPRGPHDRLAAQVNDFLASDQPVLDVTHTMGWWMVLLLLFPLAGLYMMFGARNVTEVELDEVNGLLHVRKRRWWRSGSVARSLPVKDVAAVELAQSRRKSRMTRRVVLRLWNGDAVPLFGFSTSGKGPMRRQEQLQALLRRSPQYQPEVPGNQGPPADA